MTTNQVTLYIATHNKTGLKYFGKTTKYYTVESLQENYHGSGTYWTKHKTKHGDDVTMEIYGIYSLDEVKEIALKFSEDNNIVKSKNWANLTQENGLDGGALYGMLGKKHSDETKKAISEAHKGKLHTNATKNKLSKIAKDRESPMLNKSHSEETKNKISKTKKGTVCSEDTKNKMSKAKQGKKLSEKTKKAISESSKGKTHTNEMKKYLSDKAKNRKQVKCPHCSKLCAPSLAVRWHFDNCKKLNKPSL